MSALRSGPSFFWVCDASSFSKRHCFQGATRISTDLIMRVCFRIETAASRSEGATEALVAISRYRRDRGYQSREFLRRNYPAEKKRNTPRQAALPNLPAAVVHKLSLSVDLQLGHHAALMAAPVVGALVFRSCGETHRSVLAYVRGNPGARAGSPRRWHCGKCGEILLWVVLSQVGKDEILSGPRDGVGPDVLFAAGMVGDVARQDNWSDFCATRTNKSGVCSWPF